MSAEMWKGEKIKGDFKDINVDLKNGSVIC